MAKSKHAATVKGSVEPLSAWKRHRALLDLVRYIGSNGRDHLTQLEYELAEDKEYSVQFFVRHWGSWAKAVQKARELGEFNQAPEPEPSPFAGYVMCLCGKACHCEKRFWSPDRRRIRMCDACRVWSDKVSVDDQLLYFTEDSPSNSQKAKPQPKRGRPSKVAVDSPV